MDKRGFQIGDAPMPHQEICKIPLESGDLLRHLEQLWDEVQRLKKAVRELKAENKELQADIRETHNTIRRQVLFKNAPSYDHIGAHTIAPYEED
jgi:regulator of replication initiation timing